MQSALLEFEPDQRTVDLLGQEHHHGSWIGPRLLDLANRIRNCRRRLKTDPVSTPEF
jgi:hypothetical protein